jgi:hypothetical protein
LGGAVLLSAVVAGSSYARVEADPNKDYVVAPEAGAWMICAASFMGDTASQQAHALVLELRTKYDLPAYMYNRGAEQRREQDEELDRRRRQQQQFLQQLGADPSITLPLRRSHIAEQYAVLIGGFRDIDGARRELDRIKKLDAPKSVPLATLVNWLKPKAGGDPEPVEKKVNPFTSSFVVPNPTVPTEHRRDDTPDAFLKQLNGDEKYSLLKCSKPWTLAVKEFRGAAVVQAQAPSSSFLDKLGWGSHEGELLNAAGLQAEEVARALRAMHFDAYVWHTRYSSIVTVGGYDSDGDAQLLQNKRTLANLKLGSVELSPIPVAMPVPHF